MGPFVVVGVVVAAGAAVGDGRLHGEDGGRLGDSSGGVFSAASGVFGVAAGVGAPVGVGVVGIGIIDASALMVAESAWSMHRQNIPRPRDEIKQKIFINNISTCPPPCCVL